MWPYSLPFQDDLPYFPNNMRFTEIILRVKYCSLHTHSSFILLRMFLIDLGSFSVAILHSASTLGFNSFNNSRIGFFSSIFFTSPQKNLIRNKILPENNWAEPIPHLITFFTFPPTGINEFTCSHISFVLFSWRIFRQSFNHFFTSPFFICS